MPVTGGGGGGGGGFGNGGGLQVFLRADDLLCVPDGDDLLECLLFELIANGYRFTSGYESGPGMQKHAKAIGERLAEAKMACG